MAGQEFQQALVDANPGSFSSFEGITPNVPAEYDLVAPVLEKGNVVVAWDRWSVNMPSQSMIDYAISQMQSLINGDIDVDQFVESLDSEADKIRYTN
jgi:raffinose/stachyose/melibiose transport system substrate-binding protein